MSPGTANQHGVGGRWAGKKMGVEHLAHDDDEVEALQGVAVAVTD